MLEDSDFEEMTRQVMYMADRNGGGRVVSVLEGGYNLDTLGETVRITSRRSHREDRGALNESRFAAQSRKGALRRKEEMKPELTENALRVLEKRILTRDNDGRVAETPEDMFRRVARSVSEADLQHGTPTDAAAAEKLSLGS